MATLGHPSTISSLRYTLRHQPGAKSLQIRMLDGLCPLTHIRDVLFPGAIFRDARGKKRVSIRLMLREKHVCTIRVEKPHLTTREGGIWKPSMFLVSQFEVKCVRGFQPNFALAVNDSQSPLCATNYSLNYTAQPVLHEDDSVGSKANQGPSPELPLSKESSPFAASTPKSNFDSCPLNPDLNVLPASEGLSLQSDFDQSDFDIDLALPPFADSADSSLLFYPF